MMNHKNLCLAVCLFLFFFKLQAKQAPPPERHVKVTITDDEDEQKVPFCIIRQISPVKLYKTNRQGTAEIIISCNTNFEIKCIGYQSFRFSLNLNSPSVRSIRLKRDNHVLKTAKIIENRTIRNHTSTVEMVNKNTLNHLQNKAMAEILSSIGGCRILSTGAMIEKPVVEGITGSRIAIVENHAKIAGQHWGNDHAPEIDVPSYAHVSVIKGAESVKYGANALGGVVLVNTDLNPMEKDTHAAFQTSYSSNGRMYGANGYRESSLPAFGNFRYRIGCKYYRGGDYHTPEYLLNNTGSILKNARLDLAYRYKAFDLRSHLSFYDTQIGIFRGSLIASERDLADRYKLGQPPASILGPFSYRISFPKQYVQHLLWSLQLGCNLSSRDRLQWRYSLQKDYRREYSLRLGKYKNRPDFAFRLWTNSLNGSWQHVFSEKINLKSGVNLVFSNNVSDRNTGAVPLIPNYVAAEAGLYFIGHCSLTPKTEVETGIRYDHKYANSAGYDWLGLSYGGVKHYNSVSASAGIRTSCLPDQTLNANLGLAWRAPEMNELYSHGVHHGEAVYEVGNPDLKTEKAVKLSSGYAFSKNKIRISANGYVNYILDYIYDAPKFHDVNGKKEADYSLQNAGIFTKYFYMQANGLFMGADVSLNLGEWRGWDYTLRGEWIRASNLTTKGFFPNIPTNRYEQTLRYRRKRGKTEFSIALNHAYVAKQTRSNAEVDLLPDTPPAYQLINAGLSFTYHFSFARKAEVYVNGHNLLNTLYKEYTDRLRYFMHEKGRDINIGIRYSF